LTTGRRLLAGASWVYASQLVTVGAQFIYAGITSRAVLPQGFGAYAIALSVAGLVSLLATGGLGQTVSRMVEIDRIRLRALVTYALLLGAGGGGLLFVSAPVWSLLWGVEESAEPIRWLTVSGSLSPLVGLATGLMARSGKFRQLALITLVGNMAGMAVGCAAVLTWRSSSSLVVSSTTAQFLILGAAMCLTDGHLWGLARLKSAKNDIGYSGKLVSNSLLSYLTGNIVKLSMTRGISAASLGYWNRAEVLTSIPLQQMQAAVVRAVYPEFRHDLERSRRAKVVWTDMLILVSWLALPLSATVFVVVPRILPVLFGGGWEVAASIAGPLAVVGGLQMVSTLLASAVEALGRFRWMWSTEVLLILIQLAAAVSIFVFHDIWIAVVALLATNIIRHAWHVWLVGKIGYLDVKRLGANYFVSVCFSGGLGLIVWAEVALIEKAMESPICWVIVLVVAASFTIFCYGFRNRLPVVILARRYGLLPGGKVKGKEESGTLLV
jgi:O-antigen/teichoic acid export membrane protein